jgi:mono/diheme cytochrome c family protein
MAYALLMAALVASACRPGLERAAPGVRTAPPVRTLTEDERAGEAVYARENCARCHTLLDAAPDEGPVELPAATPPSVLDSRVGPDLGLEGHRRSDDWHYAHLYAPDFLVPGSRMPASRHLFRTGPGGRPEPDEDARLLVAWLQSLGRGRRDVWAEARSREPEIPIPDRRPDAERLALGRRLYPVHCASCHGTGGDGRGPAAALLLRPPRDFVRGAYRFRSTAGEKPPADADLFRSITLGTGTGAAMPSFAHLPADDRWALVRRLREFAPPLAGRPLDEEAIAAASSRRVAARDAGEAAPEAGTRGSAPNGDPVAGGKALYAELGCAACHGAEAEGRAAPLSGEPWRDEEGRALAGSGDLRHPCGLRGGASAEAIDRALRSGVGEVMPSFASSLEGRPDAARTLAAWLASLDPEEARRPTSP